MMKLLGFSTLIALVLLLACGRMPEAGVERGAALFDICAACHGDAGEGDHQLDAPAIAGMQEWYLEAQLVKFATGVRGAHPDDPAGLRMAPMARTLRQEGDIASVAAYVATLPRSDRPRTLDGDARAGKTSFTVCIACHGADAAGNEATGAPSLLGADDWYMARQIRNFKARIRGADPGDSTGAQMAAMAATLPTEQSVADVLAYVASLSGAAQKEQP